MCYYDHYSLIAAVDAVEDLAVRQHRWVGVCSSERSHSFDVRVAAMTENTIDRAQANASQYELDTKVVFLLVLTYSHSSALCVAATAEVNMTERIR